MDKSDIKIDMTPDIHIPARVVPGEVTITMPLYAAQVLRSITGKVAGGGPVRQATDALYYALGDAKVPDMTVHCSPNCLRLVDD
jgi:hypothetical protein